MHYYWQHALVLLSLCLAYGTLSAQDIPRGLHLSISRQNNFTYSTRLDFRHRWEKERYRLELNFHHDNLYNSFRKTDPFVQLYIRTHIWQHFDLKPGLSLSSWIESDQFFNTGNQAHSIYLGTTWRPTDWLEFTPLIGYSWDYRSQILDQGLSPALLFQAQYQWENGLQMESRVLARNKFIHPRLQRNVMVQSQWSSKFSQDASLAFSLRGGSNQMDNYTLGSIKQIKADTIGGALDLQYQLVKGLFWESHNQLNLTRRQFDYGLFTAAEAEFNDLSFNQLDIYTRQKLSTVGKKFDAYFVYEYQNLGRRYELENSMELPNVEFTRLREREQQKDYFRNQISMDLRLNYRLNERHALTLTGNNRYLQYDTPSEDNFDDHDELNYGLSLEGRSRWSKGFSTRYELLAGVRRYAFLYQERSQDNYTQHNLRMEFQYDWQFLPAWRLSGQQFIYVTYNVKDFEDRNLTDRSTRNLESRLLLQYRPSRKWESNLSLYRKEIHVSYLNWDAFAETTLDTTTTYLAEWVNKWQLKSPVENSALFLDLGYKHFSQLRLLNTSMVNLSNVLTPINLHIRNHQTGPTTGFRFRTPKPASISVWIWWQLQYQDFRFHEIDDFTTLSSNYREATLNEAKVNFRPFFRLELNVLL
jgi:hypothetical protein